MHASMFLALCRGTLTWEHQPHPSPADVSACFWAQRFLGLSNWWPHRPLIILALFRFTHLAFIILGPVVWSMHGILIGSAMNGGGLESEQTGPFAPTSTPTELTLPGWMAPWLFERVLDFSDDWQACIDLSTSSRSMWSQLFTARERVLRTYAVFPRPWMLLQMLPFFDNHMDLMHWTMTSNRRHRLLLKVRQVYPCYFATAPRCLPDWRIHLLREVYMEARLDFLDGRSSSVVGGSFGEGRLAALDFWLSH